MSSPPPPPQSPPPAAAAAAPASGEDQGNTNQRSGFDRIKKEEEFKKLTDLISKIQTHFETTVAVAATTTTSTISTTNTDSATDSNDAAATTTTTTADKATDADITYYKRQVDTLSKDVHYIKKHIDSLESSPNKKRIQDLLRQLMGALDRSEFDFIPRPRPNTQPSLTPNLINPKQSKPTPYLTPNSKRLIQIVAKLKLCVPPIQAGDSEDPERAEKKKEEESPFISMEDKETAAADIVKELVKLKIPQWRMDGLRSSYNSLNYQQRLCLLCFSVFPCDVYKDQDGILNQKSLVIKNKILIYWWVGEGFIDLSSGGMVAPDTDPSQNQMLHPVRTPNADQIPEENSNQNPSLDVNQNPGSQANPARRPNANPEPDTTRRGDVDGGRNEATEVSPAKTIEEIGEQILKVLAEKAFIEPVMEKGRESGSCSMHPFVHSFVTALAKRVDFFNFSNENGKLTPFFLRSRRACLLKRQIGVSSSCELWTEYAESRDKLQRFEKVNTLFNVNESVIDIKPEWFSKMRHLSVLHLGSWHSGTAEHIEVEDQKFLECLKIMKRLKHFSLQGVSTIMTLPDSVCELTNLLILDLRECHNLEELPADIGSLKNLTHLDITNCHLLTKLPKGISLLSKLEVLRGFVINEQASDLQNKKNCILSRWWRKAKGCVIHDLCRCKRKEVCILKHLLKLEKLRELSIVVYNKEFPNREEVKVFKKMKALRKLKISWERSFKDDGKSSDQNETTQPDTTAPQESSNTCGCCALCKKSKHNNSSAEEVAREAQNGTDHEASSACKCLEVMKCFKQQSNPTNAESTIEFLDKIDKLELWCFPHETAPEWLVPEQLKSLQKLYIKGGDLKDLPEDAKWEKVTTLRLKYLHKLVIKWTNLKAMFPNMTYLEKYECKNLNFFPCDEEGVWKKENEFPR